MKIKNQIQLIEEWAKDRGLDKKGTVEGQTIKTAEEIAELIKAISKDKIEDIKDSIGDIFVTFVIGCMLENINIYSLLEEALNLFKENEPKLRKTHYILELFEDEKEQILKMSAICTLSDLTLNILTESYKDVVGNGIAFLMQIAVDYNLEFEECVEAAYKEISKRKGKMVNGTFVKESDLNE